MYVKIKSWNKMKKEYGLTIQGDIDCKIVFTQEMEDSLPNYRVIEVSEKENGRYIWDHLYSITNDMIEKIIDKKENPEYFI